MTKLEAINIILAGLGEAELEELTEPYPADIRQAFTTLDTVTKEIQLTAWHFNTETDYTLMPDVTGQIRIPNDVHRIISKDPCCPYVLRNGKIFDEEKQTFNINKKIKIDVVRIFPFENIPLSFRHYVAIRAARKFQNNVLGSNEIRAFQEQDELEARLVCLKEEQAVARPTVQRGGVNILNGWSVGKTLRR